ncbi:MAG TPA: hypothetical protein VGS07_08965 [Thermoanaerobaculia bacterium]|nr:hypothetical protein [Thermoanaerobaculia bacterium]
MFVALLQQEKVFAGCVPQWDQQVRRAVLQSVKQEPPWPGQWLMQVSCWVSQLFRQVSQALMAMQSWVWPQQVTLPLALEQVPVATVQLSVDPAEHVAVQVWVAETIAGLPHIARNTTVISPAITKALRMLSPFR